MNLTDYRQLGSTGLKVSPIALGTMTFGNEWGWGIKDSLVMSEMISIYMDMGGNFIDTANVYQNGKSEAMLGELISPKCRQSLILSTKFGMSTKIKWPNSGGCSRVNIIRSLEDSLRRLRTEYIDIYWMHTYDPTVSLAEIIRTLSDLVGQGKIRYYGLSNVPAYYTALMVVTAVAHHVETPTALQLEYSLVERNIENEHIPLCKQMGLGLVTYAPLAGGYLTGKYMEGYGNEGWGTGRLLTDSNPLYKKDSKINAEIVKNLWDTQKANPSASMAQLAIGWVLSRGVSSVIVGASNVEQLKHNLEIFTDDVPLSETTTYPLLELTECSKEPARYPYKYWVK